MAFSKLVAAAMAATGVAGVSSSLRAGVGGSNAICPRELQLEIGEKMEYYRYKGIEKFYDINSVTADPALFKKVSVILGRKIAESGATVVVGLDARGFLFIPSALEANVPFVMARKAGKMPNSFYGKSYETEYDKKTQPLGIQKHRIKKGDKVVVIDDLIATGGTMKAAADIVTAMGGEIVGCAALVEIKVANGAAKIRDAGCGDNIWTLVDESVLNTKAKEQGVDDGFAHAAAEGVEKLEDEKKDDKF